MTRLDGKVAIVTGASRGIGPAFARTLAGAGASIVAVARSADALQDLVVELEGNGADAISVPADVSAEDDLKRIVAASRERFGRIDILINNAAIVHRREPLVDFEPQMWRRIVEVNLIAPALLTRAVLPTMIDQGSGKIIFVSSIGGRRGTAGQTAYKATKAAIINLTESVAAEVKRHGIDVNCICPGGVDTPGLRNAFGDDATSQIPSMPPSTIADLALFLVSDASAALVGAALDAFGGSSPIFQPPVTLSDLR